MADENRQPPMRYVGKTVEEQIQSAQMFTVGRGIMQRFGQQMTEDEKSIMTYCLGMFIEPATGEQGAEAPQQYQQPQQHYQQPPTQQPPQAPGGPRQPAGKKQP